jgi:hypothetical protein
MVLEGGIDATTFASADLAFVEREVTGLVEKVKPYRGVLIGSGDVVPKNAHLETIRLIQRLVTTVGVYN